MNELDKKIQELEEKIAHAGENTAETWTRVTGYYRMISAFNPGKKQEVIERLEYLIPE